MVAAILGLRRDEYYRLFGVGSSLFALKISNPIKKKVIVQNLIDTKTGFYLWDNKGQRTQIPYEYLKNPKYRVYVWLGNGKTIELRKLIERHQCVYNIYLGIAGCLANFDYVGVFGVESKNTCGTPVDISSVIKSSEDFEYVPEEGKVYGRIRIPGYMELHNEKRRVHKFIDVIYEENGKPIKIKRGKYYEIKDLNVNVSFL